MNLGIFEYYLIIINAIGFILCIIDILIRKHDQNKGLDILIRICSFIGESLGIVLGILFFERKTQKDVMMTRVFVNCLLIIQVIIVLFVEGVLGEEINLKFWIFFDNNKWLLWYLLIINIVTLVMFAKDKIAAAEHRTRIRIITLLVLCALGGTVGGLAGMYIFHHKTKKDYFKIGVPLIMVMHLFVLFYIINL